MNRAFPKWGCLCVIRSRDKSILGSILGSPCFRKLRNQKYGSKYWLAFKELKFSYYNKEAPLLPTLDNHYLVPFI